MPTRTARTALAAVTALYAALCVLAFHVDFTGDNAWFLGIATALWLVATALLVRCRLSPRHVTLVVLAVGALLQLLALTRSPLTSDDANRYLWDGHVQLSGVDPYSYPPSSPRLAHLREAQLFGSGSACTHPIPGGCTSINRPEVRTIYPPVAQAAFTVGRLLSLGDGLFAFQLLAALGALAVAALLARRALRDGAAVWPVALWAWSPVVVSEFGQNGHIDWLGVVFTVLALQAGTRHRAGLAGLLTGLAIATKLYPGVVLPALMRRRPVLVIGVAVAVVALVYLPHVIAVGPDVIGYLPGYLNEQGYGSGDRLMLLGLVLPHPVDSLAGALVLAAVALWAWRRADPDTPEQAATVVTGTALLVATPVYGWYGAILIALAVLSRRYEWLPVAFASSVCYLIRGEHTYVPDVIVYALALLAMLAGWRYRTSRTQHDADPLESPGVAVDQRTTHPRRATAL